VAIGREFRCAALLASSIAEAGPGLPAPAEFFKITQREIRAAVVLRINAN